jgi:hypothetical protein
MNFSIIDSATGETIGFATITGMEDEDILAWLCSHGYLTGQADDFEITRSYPFAEGELVVIDLETNAPVLKLELPEQLEAA